MSELPPKGRIVVISPHLDDAVLSLGGTIAGAARQGARVEVVTVFACDPASRAPAGRWDAAAGFATEGEAAIMRRQEDRRACEVLGAKPIWLPFGDRQYERRGDDQTIRAAAVECLAGAEAVLVPGSPLLHPDHACLANLLVRDELPVGRVGFYREQPYGSSRWARRQRAKGRNISGAPLPGLPPFEDSAIVLRDRLAKWRAAGEYRSQLRLLDGWPHRALLRLCAESVAWNISSYGEPRT